MLFNKVYEEAMKEGGFSSNFRIVLMVVCHLAIIVQMVLQQRPLLSFLLAVIAFMLKWSDYKIFILFREYKFALLLERLLLTNELAVILIVALYKYTLELQYNNSFLAIMIGFGLLSYLKKFPKKLFRLVLLLFLLVENLLILSKIKENPVNSLVGFLLVWSFFTLKVVVG